MIASVVAANERAEAHKQRADHYQRCFEEVQDKLPDHIEKQKELVSLQKDLISVREALLVKDQQVNVLVLKQEMESVRYKINTRMGCRQVEAKLQELGMSKTDSLFFTSSLMGDMARL